MPTSFLAGHLAYPVWQSYRPETASNKMWKVPEDLNSRLASDSHMPLTQMYVKPPPPLSLLPLVAGLGVGGEGLWSQQSNLSVISWIKNKKDLGNISKHHFTWLSGQSEPFCIIFILVSVLLCLVFHSESTVLPMSHCSVVTYPQPLSLSLVSVGQRLCYTKHVYFSKLVSWPRCCVKLFDFMSFHIGINVEFKLIVENLQDVSVTNKN